MLLVAQYRKSLCLVKSRLTSHTEGSMIITSVYVNPKPQRISNNYRLYLILFVLVISSRYLISNWENSRFNLCNLYIQISRLSRT